MESSSAFPLKENGPRGFQIRLRSAFGVIDEARNRWRHRRRIWLIAGAAICGSALAVAGWQFSNQPTPRSGPTLRPHASHVVTAPSPSTASVKLQGSNGGGHFVPLFRNH